MNYNEACQWLDLDPSVTLQESSVKTAFRRAAIREHPDKSSHPNATERFQHIQQAYEYISKCVEMNETGPNANHYRTDADYESDDDLDDDEEHVNQRRAWMEEMLAKMLLKIVLMENLGGGASGVSVDMGEDGTFAFGFGSHPDHSRSSFSEHDSEEEELERRRQREERKKREREQAEEALLEKMEEETQARRRAHEEGRDFFEGWETKALKQEATKRRMNVHGLQRASLIELLIEDENNRRRKRELKEKAPLLNEIVEVVGSEDPVLQHLIGKKAKAVDFDNGAYKLT